MEFQDSYVPLISDEYIRFISYSSFIRNGNKISSPLFLKVCSRSVTPSFFSNTTLKGNHFLYY